MQNDNLIKPPATPYGDRTMKIRYAGHNQSTGEFFVLFFFFCFLVLPIVSIWGTIALMGDRISFESEVTFWDIIPRYIPHMIAALGFLALFLFFRSKRHKRLAKIKETIEKGQLVFGSIQSIEAVSTGSDGDHTEYFYRIKYKKPGSEEETEFNTPPLAGNPQIKSKELPLMVKVYIYEDVVYADEIINPPIEKVSSRKRIRKILIVFMILFALSGIFLAGANLTLGLVLFGIGMRLMTITNILDRV